MQTFRDSGWSVKEFGISNFIAQIFWLRADPTVQATTRTAVGSGDDDDCLCCRTALPGSTIPPSRASRALRCGPGPAGRGTVALASLKAVETGISRTLYANVH